MVDVSRIYNYNPNNIAPELLQATQDYVLVPEENFMPTDEVKASVMELVEEPAPDIISFPFLTPEYCAQLVELCEGIGKFDHRPGDAYPAPEMDLKDISPYVNTTHIQNIEKHILPIACSRWSFPLVWLSSSTMAEFTSKTRNLVLVNYLLVMPYYFLRVSLTDTQL